MSHRKDRERALHTVYRSGSQVRRADWDKHQRELQEVAEEQKLKALGLVSSRLKPKLLVAQRAGLNNLGGKA